MAAVRKSLKPLAVLSNSSLCRWKEGSQPYSQYRSSFLNPVTDKEELNRIVKESSKEEILGSFRKAPPIDFSYAVNYNEDVVKFTNILMRKGKKIVARNVMESAFTRIKHIQIRKYQIEKDEKEKEKIVLSPLQIFLQAVSNCTPLLDLKKIKKSGTWYKVPVAIGAKKAKFSSMKWLLEAAKEKDMKTPLEETLAREFLDASAHKGKAINKKIEFHKLCEANKGYASFQWA